MKPFDSTVTAAENFKCFLSSTIKPHNIFSSPTHNANWQYGKQINFLCISVSRKEKRKNWHLHFQLGSVQTLRYILARIKQKYKSDKKIFASTPPLSKCSTGPIVIINESALTGAINHRTRNIILKTFKKN